MTGIYADMINSPISLGPFVFKARPLGVSPKYRGRLDMELDEILDVANGIRVEPIDAGYLSQKGLVGEEDGKGHAYIADNLTGIPRIVAADHERIGAAMSLRGYGHDDPTIARTQLDVYGKAFMTTLRGARKMDWVSHDEYLNYMREAYEAGLIER